MFGVHGETVKLSLLMNGIGSQRIKATTEIQYWSSICVLINVNSFKLNNFIGNLYSKISEFKLNI
jgi:hypothetical protein